MWLYTTNRSPSGWNVQRKRELEPRSRLSLSYCTKLLSCRSGEKYTLARAPRSCWVKLPAGRRPMFRSLDSSKVAARDGLIWAVSASWCRVPS